MNILHHKSWHVRNRNNIEKVRKDEKEAREKEKEELRRSALAEQEARTNFLRQKSARNNDFLAGKEESLALVAASTSSSNVELFKANDERVDNKEHAAEERAEKEKLERKLGILKYLGEGSAELQQDVDRPWYFKAPETNSLGEEIELKRKSNLDPLVNLKHYVEVSKKKKDKKKKDKKEKKLKKKKKDKKTLSIKDLRKARLKREKEERERRDQLLNKDNKKAKQDEDVEMDLRKRSYNNQFLPDMIRKKY